MENLKDKVKSRLDEYIEFDSDLLFTSKLIEDSFIPSKRLVRIFGGAIRDSIADMPIQDIDILVGAKSMKYLKKVLSQNGYKYKDSLIAKDLSHIYNTIQVISEPHTWIKNEKIIQLIRPRIYTNPEHEGFRESTKNYEKSFVNLIQNVDISCCGVSYDGDSIYENYEGAILNCLTRSFSGNKFAKMYSENRFQHRKYKLEERGWKEITSGSMRRDKVIEFLLDKEINFDELNYISEYYQSPESIMEKSKGHY